VWSPRPFVLAVLGIAELCALDAAMKELTRSYLVAFAVLGRYVFGTDFALAVWYWKGRPRLTREMVPSPAIFALRNLGRRKANEILETRKAAEVEGSPALGCQGQFECRLASKVEVSH
jgi:hypothetical protein